MKIKSIYFFIIDRESRYHQNINLTILQLSIYFSNGILSIFIYNIKFSFINLNYQDMLIINLAYKNQIPVNRDYYILNSIFTQYSRFLFLIKLITI